MSQLPDTWVRAYAAGLIDGEGSITVYNNSNHQTGIFPPRVEVGMITKAPLDFMREHFEGNVNRTHKGTCWRWTLSGRFLIRNLMVAIQPYVLVKSEHIKLMFKYIDEDDNSRPLSEKEFNRRKAIRQRYSEINSQNWRGSRV